jgi:hypothetical protein
MASHSERLVNKVSFFITGGKTRGKDGIDGNTSELPVSYGQGEIPRGNPGRELLLRDVNDDDFQLL